MKHAVQTEKNKNAEAGNSFELIVSGDGTWKKRGFSYME